MTDLESIVVSVVWQGVKKTQLDANLGLHTWRYCKTLMYTACDTPNNEIMHGLFAKKP